MSGRWFLGLVVATGMWLLGVQNVPKATAQVTAVIFGIPVGSEIVPPSGDDPGDNVIFVGREEAVVDGTPCGGMAGNVIQSVVIVDPGGVRSGRLNGVLVISQTGRVQPGTKLQLPMLQGNTCFVNGVEYQKYTALFE